MGGSWAVSLTWGPRASLFIPTPPTSPHYTLLLISALASRQASRQAFLISDKGSHWPLPASIVLRVDYLRKKKEEHHSSNSSLSTRNDTIDLAWVTCPFPEAKLHLGAFWLALSEAQRLEPAHVNHLAAGRGGVSFRDAGQTRSLTSSTVDTSPPAINTLVSTHDPVLAPRNSSLPWLTSLPPRPCPPHPTQMEVIRMQVLISVEELVSRCLCVTSEQIILTVINIYWALTMGQKIDHMLYILTALNPQSNTGG